MSMNHAERLKIALNRSLGWGERKRWLESILSSTDCPRDIKWQAEEAYSFVLDQVDGGKREQATIDQANRDHIKNRENR